MPHTIVTYNPFARTCRGDRLPAEIARDLPLPVGFPIVTQTITQAPVPEIVAYLATFDPPARQRTGIWPHRTCLAYGSDLKAWADMLEYLGVPFANPSQAHLDQFVDLQISYRNPRSRDFLSAGTVRRRIGTVAQLYATATAVCPGTVKLETKHLSKKLWGLDHVPDDQEPGLRDEKRRLPKCMTAEDWQDIRDALGPLPSECRSASDQSVACRDRLEAEVAVSTGMREFEVANFPVGAIASVAAEDLSPMGFVRVLLTKTKRLRARWVFVPNWLVVELVQYHRGERQQAVEAAARRWGDTYREPRSLFLNGVDAGADAGHARRPEMIAACFRDAVVSAGATIPIAEIPGVRRARRYARYSFHSLRHSFALWLYFILSERFPGRDNWKVIQGRLGHKKLSTTTETYLDVSKSLEFLVGDLINAAIQASIHVPRFHDPLSSR